MRVGGEERGGLQCGEGGEYDMIEGWKGEGADNGRSTRLCVGNDISIKREKEREREGEGEREMAMPSNLIDDHSSLS